MSLWEYVLAFFRHDLQKHFAAEADVAELVALAIDRLLGWILCPPCAAFHFCPVAFTEKRKLEDVGRN
jgi:hypothetical protein